MSIDQHDALTGILTHIAELLAEEVGPVAHILSEEVKDEWEGGLLKRGQKPSLRYMPSYIHKLSLLIEDQENRERFLNSVYSIRALSVFRKA